MSRHTIQNEFCACAAGLLLSLAIVAPVPVLGQSAPQPAGVTASSFQGSVVTGQVSPEPVGLSLDDAIQRQPALRKFLCQPVEEYTKRADTYSRLKTLLS